MIKYKHIFFDLDRTLWDFDGNSAQTLLEIIAYFKLDKIVVKPQAWVEEYKKINIKVWKLYEERKLNKKELRIERFNLLLRKYSLNDDRLVKDMSEYYIHNSPTKTSTMPHAKEVLEYLFPKYKLYVISNGFQEIQNIKLRSAGIDRYFLKVFTSESIGVAKPNKRIFQDSLKSVNARKNQSLLVGDSIEKDIQGAKKFGIDQIWYNPDKIQSDFVPSYEVSSLEQLKSIL